MMFHGASDDDCGLIPLVTPPASWLDNLVGFLGGEFLSALLACAFVFAASIRW